MPDRPYILLSCGMSIDGYLDNASEPAAAAVQPGRPRAGGRGARGQRRDPGRRADRAPGTTRGWSCAASAARRAGLPRPAADADQGDGPTEAPPGPGGPLLLDRRDRASSCTARAPAVAGARERLGAVATVVDGGHAVRMRRLVEDLHDRGTRRLMVEGGGSIHTQFLTAGLADELHLVVAPFFVGDSRAPRFVEDGRFPWNQDRRATLADVRAARRRRAPPLRTVGDR